MNSQTASSSWNKPFCLSVWLSQKGVNSGKRFNTVWVAKGQSPNFFVYPLKCNNFRRATAARNATRRTGSSTRTSARGGERRGNRGERKSLRRRRRRGTGTNPVKMDWRKKTRGRRRRNRINKIELIWGAFWQSHSNSDENAMLLFWLNFLDAMLDKFE